MTSGDGGDSEPRTRKSADMGERFKGKVVIVTGGSRGIGLAIAQAFADEYAQVVIASQNETRGNAAVEMLQRNGRQAVFIRTDVSNQPSAAISCCCITLVKATKRITAVPATIASTPRKRRRQEKISKPFWKLC